jgi:hypothetical protein
MFLMALRLQLQVLLYYRFRAGNLDPVAYALIEMVRLLGLSIDYIYNLVTCLKHCAFRLNLFVILIIFFYLTHIYVSHFCD